MNLHDEKRYVFMPPQYYISLVADQYACTVQRNKEVLDAFIGDHQAISILRRLSSDEASVEMNDAINQWIHITMQSVTRDVSL